MMVVASLMISIAASQSKGQTQFAQGLQFPQRLIFTPRGNLLVSEGGTEVPNTGRVSVIGRDGTRHSLLEGLPAGHGHGITAFGPAGMALDGRVLYLVIGEGDVQVGPPFTPNLNGPSSPIFASVLRIQFSADVDNIASSFQLTPGALHWALLDGYEVELRNASGDRATVYLLTAFRTWVRNVLGSTAPMRPADPYSAVLDAANNALYVVDSSSETLVEVNTLTGRYAVLTRFQPLERTTPTGPQYVDNVPTAVCPAGDSYLVSFLSAAPFPAGESTVRRWSPSDGPWSSGATMIRGLTRAVDMICLRGQGATPRVVTVEYLTDAANPNAPTGRVQIFDGPNQKVLAEGLPLPVGIAQDPVSNDLFVVTLAGQILRLPAP
jgi:DNA-binding beta-propeller fold protein YncE